jgi:hypothetical protein
MEDRKIRSRVPVSNWLFERRTPMPLVGLDAAPLSQLAYLSSVLAQAAPLRGPAARALPDYDPEFARRWEGSPMVRGAMLVTVSKVSLTD